MVLHSEINYFVEIINYVGKSQNNAFVGQRKKEKEMKEREKLKVKNICKITYS